MAIGKEAAKAALPDELFAWLGPPLGPLFQPPSEWPLQPQSLPPPRKTQLLSVVHKLLSGGVRTAPSALYTDAVAL